MSDLTSEEQTHVRAALRFLRARCGGWRNVCKALRVAKSSMARITGGGTVTASVAVRVARLVKVGVDDVLTGRFPPPGTCPHCGHCPLESKTLTR